MLTEQERQAAVDAYRGGMSLDEICSRWNLPHYNAFYSKILRDGERRVKSVPRETREAILSAEHGSVRSLAARYGVSKTTVHRIRTSDYLEWDDDDADELETVQFVDHYWRCPDHGGVNVSPCPICAARGVIRESDNIMPARTSGRKFETILTAQ